MPVHESRAEKDLKRRISALPRRRALFTRLEEACLERGVHYDRGPEDRVAIDVMSAPSVLAQRNLDFLHRLSEAVNTYVRRMPALYAAHPEIRALLPFGPKELSWFERCWRPEHDGAQTIVSRNDVDMPTKPEDTVAFETNGCSIGGIFYSGACARVIYDEIISAPPLERARARLDFLTDACDVVYRLLEDHAKLLGAPKRFRVGILENRDWVTGITEMPSLAKLLEERGHRTVLADPRELEIRRGALVLGGEKVDVIYRNMELSDFIELEDQGADLEAVRAAFRRNAIISGIAGDFDHKSMWEVLTSKSTARFIDPAMRRLFVKHLLWTRLVREVETEGFDGEKIQLIPFIRENRERLVLKPNQSCGGDRVFVGPVLSDVAWKRAVNRALAEPNEWAVQKYHPGTKKYFPETQSPYFVTYGIISAPFGQGVLGRACKRAVVNVSRGGGLVALFRGR